MTAPRVMKHEPSLLEDLRYAVHGLCAPFACGGTLLPDQPLTLCFQDKTRLPVLRAPRVFEQEQLLQPLVRRCTPASFGQGRRTRYDRGGGGVDPCVGTGIGIDDEVDGEIGRASCRERV